MNTRQELDLESISISLLKNSSMPSSELTWFRVCTKCWPKKNLVVPTLVINPFQSSKDDLMYSIDERFVDGLMEGRVVTWQAKFFNCPRAVDSGLDQGSVDRYRKNEKPFNRNILFSEFSQCVYLEAFSLSSNFLHYVVVWRVWGTVSKVKMVVIKAGFLNSDWSVSTQRSDWSIRKPLKVKRSGKKERAHDGLMATIWTWSLVMTSSDNSKSPSARLENLPEKIFVENFRKWAAEIWFNLIAVPLNKINQKLNQHNPAACSCFIV